MKPFLIVILFFIKLIQKNKRDNKLQRSWIILYPTVINLVIQGPFLVVFLLYFKMHMQNTVEIVQHRLSVFILKIVKGRLLMATKSCIQVCMSFAMGLCHSCCSQGKSVSSSPGIWGGPETGFDQQIMQKGYYITFKADLKLLCIVWCQPLGIPSRDHQARCGFPQYELRCTQFSSVQLLSHV